MIFDEIETFDLHSLLPTQNHSKIIKLVITQQKTSKYFIIGDDKGYISVIGKGQQTKKSTFVGSSTIIDMQRILNGLMIVTPKAIAFVNFADGSIMPYFCEYNFLEDGPEIVSAAIEQRPLNLILVYAKTSNGQLIQFQPKFSSKADQLECKLVSIISLPTNFLDSSLTSFKGAIVMHSKQSILMIDSSAGSLQQSPHIQTYDLSL